jgi:phosphate transport system substrate-binding protein
MMHRTKRTLAVVAFTLVSCSTQVLPASTPTTNSAPLRLDATTAAMPLLNDLIARYSQTHPNILFEAKGGDYQVMLDRLLNGEIDYFISNHLPAEPDLVAFPIGQDGIAVIVQPDNPLTKLTIGQIRQVYQGRVNNWRDLGGDDLEISVISREDGSGTRAEFERLVMGERRTTQSARIAPSSAAMVTSVAGLPGGIGYVSMAWLDSSVKALTVDNVEPTLDNVYNNLYPLRSTLYIVGREEPKDGPYRDFIGWVQSPDGQRAVAQKYAPVLRP